MMSDTDPSVGCFRAQVRAFIDAFVTDEIRQRGHQTGTSFDPALYKALADRHWIVPDWPRAEGGDGRGGVDLAVLREELRRADAPLDGWRTTSIVANLIRAVGNDYQRQVVLPAILSGDAVCCLGISEPDSGSDAAAARTRAEPLPGTGTWRINGQKMWTTLAHVATHVFLLTRNGPEKHAGLTTFLVPMNTPGIDIKPVHTLGGERTNATFYVDVQVDGNSMVGDVGRGWDVMRLSLTFERLWDAGELLRLSDLAVRWLSSSGEANAPNLTRLGRLVTDARVARALSYRASEAPASDPGAGVYSSMAKLYGSEAQVRAGTAMLEMLGPESIRQWPDPGAAVQGEFEHAFRHAQVKTIYGGVSEVLRDLLARRALGLPRR
jgi:alkylation response protein AidB-like acyl-CoA dehydrogenase